jgi:hypothetical protein
MTEATEAGAFPDRAGYATSGAPGPGAPLPELASVAWRRPVDERRLVLFERISAAYTVIYCTPFVAAGLLLIALEPLLFPVSLVSFLHAWVIPELFAYRGARVVFPLSESRPQETEHVAQGFLGDLLDHSIRALQQESGLAVEGGRLGIWLVGEQGALLVRPGGRRVHAFCARAKEEELPPSDRIAHLLLALREDETGFATVANHAFAGAAWRIRRRLRPRQRVALAAARRVAKPMRSDRLSKPPHGKLDPGP